MKTLLRGLGYIAIAFAALCLLFVAINWRDEPLRPEVRTALNWKVPDNAFEDNGYLIMLGMNAPTGQDAAGVGRQIAKAELTRYQAYLQTHEGVMPATPTYSLSAALADTKSLCDTHKTKNCVEFYLAQDARKQATLLKDYSLLTDRFRAIRQSKNFVEIWPPFPYYDIPSYANLINAAKLEHIQVISDISKGNIPKGLDRFVENARFSRRLLKESNTLLSHIIALALVRADMRTLSELLAKYPELAHYREQLAPVVTPISAPEYSLVKAFQGERHIFLPEFNKNLQANRKKDVTDALSSSNGMIMDTLLDISFLPNATTNLTYDFYELKLKLAATDANHLDEVLASAEQEKSRLLGWGYGNFLYPKNPTGKILVLIPDPFNRDYILRQHDTDGYVRLVALQLKLTAEHVPTARIPEALEKSGVEFMNPYTLKPMEWDAANSELRFEGRQPSSKDKKNSYAVNIPLRKP